jgi:hypothetical protein
MVPFAQELTFMLEADWLTSRDPHSLQEYLRRGPAVSDRKFRLFGCACCRRISHLLADENLRQVIRRVERFADNPANTTELRNGRMIAGKGVMTARALLEAAGADAGISRALAVERPAGKPGGAFLGACAVFHLAGNHHAWKAALHAAETAAEAVAWTAAGAATGVLAWTGNDCAVESAPWTSPWNAARKAARRQEEQDQTALLRHIVGNPFQPSSWPESWPAAVVELAQALYAGEDCRLPLSDALEESGWVELADHFRREEWHPRGCWLLDLAVGKV